MPTYEEVVEAQQVVKDAMGDYDSAEDYVLVMGYLVRTGPTPATPTTASSGITGKTR